MATRAEAAARRARGLDETVERIGPRLSRAEPRRRAAARVPEGAAFTTEPELGLPMLERARAAGLPFAWVAGGSVYGAGHAIRRWAERHRIGYVPAVASGRRPGFRPVPDWIEGLPADAWRRPGAGGGAKGPRLCDRACAPCRGAAPGFRCALPVRRPVAGPGELTFHLTHAPEAAAPAGLVRVAGPRWPIESRFEQAKGEVGLGRREVRCWAGRHRRATLSMSAPAARIGAGEPVNPGCSTGAHS